MKPILPSKRKLLDLVILLVLDLVCYLLWGSLEFVVLFTLGYIWNWVTSQNLDVLFENRRFKFSTLSIIISFQNLFLKPLQRFPFWIQWIGRLFPAGIFWSMVIIFNDASMPWWGTFVGSLVFELAQLEIKMFKKEKEILP